MACEAGSKSRMANINCMHEYSALGRFADPGPTFADSSPMQDNPARRPEINGLLN
jgi:hypothetical protein